MRMSLQEINAMAAQSEKNARIQRANAELRAARLRNDHKQAQKLALQLQALRERASS